MNSSIAARLFAVLVVLTAFFQIALSAGMPWGPLAWGGNHPGTLPSNLRIASGVSVLVMLTLGLVVLVRAGLVMRQWQGWSRRLIWFVVAYCLLGIVANAITPSMWERILWLPVTILLSITSITVARGP